MDFVEKLIDKIDFDLAVDVVKLLKDEKWLFILSMHFVQ